MLPQANFGGPAEVAPHPNNLVAAKLGISIAGLGRNDIDTALTTEQIDALLAEKPEWLVAERES